MRKLIWRSGVLVVALCIGLLAWVRWRKDEPRRQSIQALGHFSEIVASGSGDALLALLVTPPTLKDRTIPEQQQFLFKALRDEISQDGIELLRKKGRFGPLKDIFPEEADDWARQAGVTAAQCLAFKLERGGERAEVVLLRETTSQTGPSFRIVRCNNVTALN